MFPPVVLQRLGKVELAFGFGFTPWQMVAGIAASAAERWDDAQEHFETALRQAAEMPHKIAQPEVRRWYAWMLIDRAEAGDHDKARTLLGEAVEMYRTIGMPKYVELAVAQRHKTTTEVTNTP